MKAFPMGGDAHRRAVHHSAVVHYDNVGVRQVFQAVPLYRNRSRPSFFFAGESSQNVGRSFIKSYCAVCLEGAIIVLVCIIFSVFAASPPVVNPDAARLRSRWCGAISGNWYSICSSLSVRSRWQTVSCVK